MSYSHVSPKAQLNYPKLMIPGPVDVQDEVLSALASPVVAHYGKEWTSLYNETIDILKKVFRTEGDVFLLVSSGTGGVEAAISSMFVPGDIIIVVVNGFFGERIASIAQLCGINVIPVISEWGKPVAPETVRAIIDENPKISGLVTVHHETSTGVLNPIKNLGEIAKDYEIPFVVDAVSSLGGEELDMDGWGIDICISASNKCLESIPGISPIAVSKNAWKFIENNAHPAPGWYLNLKVWKQYAEQWAGWHPFPVTMATNGVIALNTALELLMKEGVENRIARYRDTAHYFRQELSKREIKTYVDGNNASTTITVVHRPFDIDVTQLITFLLDRHRIRIAGGLGKINGLVFRVGHMGRAGSHIYIDSLLEALDEFLH